MSSFILSDACEWAKSMPDDSVDHIITDYEYGTFFPDVNSRWIDYCKENIK